MARATNAALVVVAAMLVMLSCGPSSANADITIHNNGTIAVTLLPLLSASIQLPVQGTVTLPVTTLTTSILNTVTNHLAGPVALVNQAVVLLVDGVVPGTLNLVTGSLLNGVFQIVGNALPLLSGI